MPISVQYVVEIPGHDPNAHEDPDTRQAVQQNMGTALGQNFVTQNFDSRQDILNYQRRATPGLDDPTLIVGQTVIDTSGNTVLDPFHKALYDTAYVQSQNNQLEGAGSGRQFVIGDINSAYLYSMGIDPSFVRATGTEAVDPSVLDPHLDSSHPFFIDSSGHEGVHMIDSDQLNFRNTEMTPEEAPNVITTLSSYQPPTTTTDEGQDRAGKALIAAGASTAAVGGMYAASGYIGTNALGNAGSAVDPMLSGGAVNPLETATTETTSLLSDVPASETTVNPLSSSYEPNPSRPGLRPRGRPPTVRQISQVIRGGGSVAEGIAAGAGAAGEGAAMFEASTAVGLGLGIAGVGMVAGGIYAVATSDQHRPGGPRGTVTDTVPNDPLANVPVDPQTANYINNMDAMYRSNGYTDGDIQLVHQAEANGIAGATSDPILQDNLVSLQEQYVTERSNVYAEQGNSAANSGATADTGGGEGGTVGPTTDPYIEPPATQQPDGNTANTGGGNGLPVDPSINSVPDESEIPNVQPPPPTPFEPQEPGAPVDIGDDTNYRGTGYSYYSFMSLPLWLRRKLLGKRIDDDDY